MLQNNLESLRMHLIIVLLASLAVGCRGGALRRRLLSDLDNDIKLNTKQTRHFHSKFVTINEKPHDVIYHKQGEPLEISCEGMGTPAPNIRWFKNDVPVYEHNLESNEIVDVNPSSLARIESTLLIPRTDYKDEYTCVISSGFNTAKATTTVYATGGSTELTDRPKLFPLAPRILVYYKVFVDTIGNNIVVPCKAKGHPRPQITWRDNRGNVITKNNERLKVLRNGELTISNIDWSDMGEYVCQADNLFGSHNVTTFIYPAKEST